MIKISSEDVQDIHYSTKYMDAVACPLQLAVRDTLVPHIAEILVQLLC